VDLPHPRRRDRLAAIHRLGPEAGLVLVQVLADQPGLLVVRPDERLPAGYVVKAARIIDVVADRAEV
jgi:hypothetical protein